MSLLNRWKIVKNGWCFENGQSQVIDHTWIPLDRNTLRQFRSPVMYLWNFPTNGYGTFQKSDTVWHSSDISQTSFDPLEAVCKDMNWCPSTLGSPRLSLSTARLDVVMHFGLLKVLVGIHFISIYMCHRARAALSLHKMCLDFLQTTLSNLTVTIRRFSDTSCSWHAPALRVFG